MVNYIKVRPYVAKKLGVESVRARYPDGNVLLWDKELKQVDPAWVFHPEEVVARIGGLMMDPYRNREEQQKTAAECTPLPWPTDPEWADPELTQEEEEAALLRLSQGIAGQIMIEEGSEEAEAETEMIEAIVEAAEEAEEIRAQEEGGDE